MLQRLCVACWDTETCFRQTGWMRYSAGSDILEAAGLVISTSHLIRVCTTSNFHLSKHLQVGRLSFHAQCFFTAGITRSTMPQPYSLFTAPTRTRQVKTVLSCPRRRCEHKYRQDQTVLSCLDPVTMSFVSSRPIFQFLSFQ